MSRDGSPSVRGSCGGASVVAQVAGALHAVHATGVVHRDVKPGNLLVRADGTVILVDFGVARSAAVIAITNADAVTGTVLYMAPEQVSGQQVSAATDVYALGAVAYHCLAAHPPFTGKAALEVALRHLHDDLPPLPADIPGPVQALVGRALAKDPADRYPTAAALAAAARAAAARAAGAEPAGGMPGVAAAPGATYAGPATTPDLAVVPITPAAPAPSRRRKAAIAAAAVTALLAAAAVTAVLTLSPASGDPPAVDSPEQSTAPASAGPPVPIRRGPYRPAGAARLHAGHGEHRTPPPGPPARTAASHRPPSPRRPPPAPNQASSTTSKAPSRGGRLRVGFAC